MQAGPQGGFMSQTSAPALLLRSQAAKASGSWSQAISIRMLRSIGGNRSLVKPPAAALSHAQLLVVLLFPPPPC